MSKEASRAKQAVYRRIRRATDPAWREKQLANAKRYYEKNPGIKRIQYVKNYLKRYGITPEQRQQMVESQAGLCACCAKIMEPTRNGVVGAVDHDHITGAVRGIVCARCNVAIAWAEHEACLDRARAYLKRYGSAALSLPVPEKELA